MFICTSNIFKKFGFLIIVNCFSVTYKSKFFFISLLNTASPLLPMYFRNGRRPNLNILIFPSAGKTGTNIYGTINN